MKTYLSFAIGCLAALGCNKTDEVAPGKVTSTDVRRDVDRAVDTASEYTKQANDEFRSKLDARVAEVEAEIVTLRAQGAELKDDAKVAWEARMTELEAKRQLVRTKLEELADSSEEAWTDMRSGAQSAWEDLEASMRKASDEF